MFLQPRHCQSLVIITVETIWQSAYYVLCFLITDFPVCVCTLGHVDPRTSHITSDSSSNEHVKHA